MYSKQDMISNHIQLAIAYEGGFNKEKLNQLIEYSRGIGITYYITNEIRRAMENGMEEDSIFRLKICDASTKQDILRIQENGMDNNNLKRLFLMNRIESVRLYALAYEEGFNQDQLDELFSLQTYERMKVYYTLCKRGVNNNRALYTIDLSVHDDSDSHKIIEFYRKRIDLEELLNNITKDDEYSVKKQLLEMAERQGMSENKLKMMAGLDNLQKMSIFNDLYEYHMNENNLRLLTQLSLSDMKFCKTAYIQGYLTNEEFEMFTKLDEKNTFHYFFRIQMDKKSFKELMCIGNQNEREKYITAYFDKVSSKEFQLQMKRDINKKEDNEKMNKEENMKMEKLNNGGFYEGLLDSVKMVTLEESQKSSIHVLKGSKDEIEKRINEGLLDSVKRRTLEESQKSSIHILKGSEDEIK